MVYAKRALGQFALTFVLDAHMILGFAYRNFRLEAEGLSVSHR